MIPAVCTLPLLLFFPSAPESVCLYLSPYPSPVPLFVLCFSPLRLSFSLFLSLSLSFSHSLSTFPSPCLPHFLFSFFHFLFPSIALLCHRCMIGSNHPTCNSFLIRLTHIFLLPGFCHWFPSPSSQPLKAPWYQHLNVKVRFPSHPNIAICETDRVESSVHRRILQTVWSQQTLPDRLLSMHACHHPSQQKISVESKDVLLCSPKSL